MLQDDVIETSLRIRAWYLTRFRGLKVRAVHATPLIPFMGAVLYARSWVLVAAG